MERIHARRGRYCRRVGGFRADGNLGIGCDGRQRNQERGSQGVLGLDHGAGHFRIPKPTIFRCPGKRSDQCPSHFLLGLFGDADQYHGRVFPMRRDKGYAAVGIHELRFASSQYPLA